jgi:monoamine oxidase
VERQGDALHPLHRPEPPLLLLLLEARPVTGFSGYEGVRQGNIHFAGEHCSTSFQGFMEGGASEGVRAANEILADLAKP